MSRRDIQRRFDEIVAFAEVERFLDTPVKRYSSGMYVRLAFAVAAHVEPDILLVDEVLAVGDAAFQRRCLGKMEEVAGEGRTVLFVSHNMTTIQSLCERAYLLDGGRLVEEGPAREVVRSYLQVMSSTVNVPLDEREDRGGDGSVRLCALRVEDADGHPSIRVGSRLRVTLSYRGDRPLRNARLWVSIYDITRAGMYLLDSDVDPGLPTELPPTGAIVCETAPINVTPGRCYMSVWLWKTGLVADYVDNAGGFDVEEDDPLGLGRLPRREWALHLLEQRWQPLSEDLAAAGAVALGPAPPVRRGDR
jgi:lipopolysaccharide transport system ATP-binding protein